MIELIRRLWQRLINHPRGIDYNGLTEAKKIAAVSQNGYIIRSIKNPSEAVQLAATSKYGQFIIFIKSPFEAVQHELRSFSPQNEDRVFGAPAEIALLPGKNAGLRLQLGMVAAVESTPYAINCLSKPLGSEVATTLLIHHPFHPETPKEILDRAPEILEEYCSGLGDVYTIGLSMAMTGEELSRTMMEWVGTRAETRWDAAMENEMM